MPRRPRRQRDNPRSTQIATSSPVATNRIPTSHGSRLVPLGFGALLLVVIDFIGRLVTGLDFIQYLLEWRTHILNFIVLGCTVLGVILAYGGWQLFLRQHRYRYLFSVGILLVSTVILMMWINSVRSRETKLIVMVAKFDDTQGDYYELRDEIFDTLEEDFKTNPEIQIEKIDEVITEDQNSGSSRARTIGKRYQADVVIWGSYRKSEVANMEIHVENLSPSQLMSLKESDVLTPDVTLKDLEKFTFQQEAGKETSSMISFLAGFIEYVNGNYKSAISYFDQAINLFSSSPALFKNQPEIYFYRATSSFRLEDYPSALQYYQKAIEIDSSLIEVYFNRGAVYLALGDYPLAIPDFDQVINFQPNMAAAYNNRGFARWKVGEYEPALSDYDKAIELLPNVEQYYSGRGNVYESMGIYPLAIIDHDRALAINPSYMIGYYNRGNVYLASGDYPKAIADYKQSINLDPSFIISYINRGIAYEKSGDYESAIKDYNQALSMNPNYELAFLNRGNTYADQSDYPQAIEDYNQAIALNPRRAETYVNRGIARSLLEDYQGAVEDFTMAIELNNPALNAFAYQCRGLVYKELGKIPESEADFAKYEELSGNSTP